MALPGLLHQADHLLAAGQAATLSQLSKCYDRIGQVCEAFESWIRGDLKTNVTPRISVKHRQAFERRSTPPGFWRTDMPTTQEEEDDRAKAREMVKAKVEERWREAMREGGRWLFKDE